MKLSLFESALAGSALAVLALSANIGRAELFDSAVIRNNTAFANSPRAIEAFPELARSPVTHRASEFSSTGNFARDRSPRVLEQYPVLTRVETFPSPGATRIKPFEIGNSAVAASPRALEQFPWLARRGGASGLNFEIAPLKD